MLRALSAPLLVLLMGPACPRQSVGGDGEGGGERIECDGILCEVGELCIRTPRPGDDSYRCEALRPLGGDCGGPTDPPCEAGLACALVGDDERCVTPCGGTAPACPAPLACADVLDLPRCLPVAGEDEWCVESGLRVAGCEGELRCASSFTGWSACRPPCGEGLPACEGDRLCAISLSPPNELACFPPEEVSCQTLCDETECRYAVLPCADGLTCNLGSCAPACETDADCEPGAGCGTGVFAGCQTRSGLDASCEYEPTDGPWGQRPCELGLVCATWCREPCDPAAPACTDPTRSCIVNDDVAVCVP